jgi:signal transduction histidine kinase
MKERALLVGGEVNIDGRKGEGTVVVVRVPIQSKVESFHA